MSTDSPLRCFHPSNLFTYASLAAGVAAIAAAFEGLRGAAGALVAAAVILDTFDGRFARLFARTADQRAIGVQLDSLADAVAFGVAPAVCMTVLRPDASGGGVFAFVWWASMFAFVAAAISRLAFYNTRHDVPGFVGLPAPVGALVWASFLLTDPGPALSAAVFFGVASAMVLPLAIPRPRGLALAAFVCWPLVVIAGHIG